MSDIIVEKKINGVVYKAKYLGIGYAIALTDRLKHENAKGQLAKILFDEMLVSPKIEVDDFEDIQTYYEVLDFLVDVSNGRIGKRISKARLKKKAEEDNWPLWRLILGSEGSLTFQAVFGKPFMTPNDVIEANYALDKFNKARQAALRKK